MHRLLVVDDEPDLLTLYELTLLREGHDVECAGSVREALQALKRQTFSLVITDMRLPDGQGIELLHHVEAAGRGEKVVVITAYGSAETAVAALKAGAVDYLTKPVDLRQFRSVVAAALGRAPAPAASPRAAPLINADRRAAPVRAELVRLVGESPAMSHVRMLVEKVSRSMAPVLVTGESGTGKELVARAIHQTSARASGPFVPVNCGAIQETLLEAEFFGYRKGAFTGAAEDRPGFFQAAQGGTLFLDEIGDLPLLMQSKLLRAVQERSVRPLGATAEVPCNARIVSATHRDLPAEVQAGKFRQDLFFRLNVIHIPVPPLRDRLNDLAPICADLLERICAETGAYPTPRVSQEALEHLRTHAFPGNVRELENMLHRALAMSAAECLGVEELCGQQGPGDAGLSPAEVQEPSPLVELPQAPKGPCEVERAQGVQTHSATMASDALSQPELPAALIPPAGAALPTDLETYLDGVERVILEQALARYRFNRTAAGASLGLSLRQMRYRMARLRIGVDSDTPESP
ncbi:MAG: sigma-54 dependent transcriptional regulator [Betaproteobacteria bacterium]